MTKKIFISLGIIVAVIIIGVILVTRHATAPDTASNSPTPSHSTSPTATPSATASPSVSPSATPVKTYTLADIALHPNQASCWVTIDGSVYDLTSWIKQHPGGSARILSICGKDGSVAFSTQHSGDARPNEVLKTFFIGTLAQ
ncbi:MAG: cytochrome b5 domain-containing protein [Patescibacteria group bacterium]